MTENTEVGKVKFFDHKKGYGFVEVINPESKHVNTEHFLHYSEIKCKIRLYVRMYAVYLVQIY